MDPSLFDDMITQENRHWWFLSRRAVMQSVLSRLRLPANALVLDAGCGTGGNLGMLSRFGTLYAFELNDKARAHAVSRHTGVVESGSLPGGIPFPGVQFDLIGLFDVLEHVEDDEAALKALVARLKPGGHICINVPAYQWLFTRHDRLHHHFRRYNKSRLLQLVHDAGLQVEFASYWNFLLFPVAACVRLVDCFNIPKDRAIGAGQPSPWVNRLLTAMVSAEGSLLKYASLPFGLSLVALAKKP